MPRKKIIILSLGTDPRNNEKYYSKQIKVKCQSCQKMQKKKKSIKPKQQQNGKIRGEGILAGICGITLAVLWKALSHSSQFAAMEQL